MAERTRARLPLLAVSGCIAIAYWRCRPPGALVSGGSPQFGYWLWAYGHFAYSDIVGYYGMHHLATHATPYLHSTVEYPVVLALWIWAAAWVPGAQSFLAVNAVGLALCAVLTVYLLYRSSPKQAWIFALSPLLVVYSLISWDLLGIFLMVAGWMLYRAHRYALAGAVLSLAVFTKLFPIVLLLYCVIALWRARRPMMVMVGSALGTALVTNVAFAVTNFGGWSAFFHANVTRGDQEGLLYFLRLVSTSRSADVVSATLVVVIVVALIPTVLRGGSPVGAAALAFAGFLLVNKVYQPQYMLWLFVLALLADWPTWALVLMSAAGVIDYANAMAVLRLEAIRSRDLDWYGHIVFPIDRAIRVSAIIAGVMGTMWRARRPNGGTSDGIGVCHQQQARRPISAS